MAFLSTGRYSILRGTPTEDEAGRVVDGKLKYSAHSINASIRETSREVYDPSSNSMNVVQTLAGRFRHGTDIKAGDIVRDDRSGVTFIVEDAVHSVSPVNKPEVRVSLSRTE